VKLEVLLEVYKSSNVGISDGRDLGSVPLKYQMA
jgi:hypothetical protein